MGHMSGRFVECGDATIDEDGHVRHVALQFVDKRIVERRHVAVFLRRQTFEPGLARMDDQRFATGLAHGARHGGQRFARLLLVDADAAFDGDGN